MIQISAVEVNKRLKDLHSNTGEHESDAVYPPTLSDRLDTIREEALCAIETAAEKGTIELLPEDIFDNDENWVNTIYKSDDLNLRKSMLRDQLSVSIHGGNDDWNWLNYTSDLLALRTDTLVQIADYLAKN